MKKHHSFSIFSLFTVALLLLTVMSCNKDEGQRLTILGGIIDDNAEEDGSKVYLSNRERWLRWENGDQIYVYAPTDNKQAIYNLSSESHRQLSGNFTNDHSDITPNFPLYAFYPPTLVATGSGDITSGSMQIFWPRSHNYRQNNDPTHPDSSFGTCAMPMVAYRPARDYHELTFHALAGILRFQLYGGSGLTEPFTIESVVFESKSDAENSRLSGYFTITKEAIEDTIRRRPASQHQGNKQDDRRRQRQPLNLLSAPACCGEPIR